ncbi:hypothetical protein Lsed01_00833 [Demequina sediminis]|uniref:Uncharacterized protein n=1 Tax=Demequina sediminis TaxID=1930058 RepID=A0ABP9WEY7_9MICO|nr:hypothetical protein GCM10025873_23040 [Demequina sediminis]
MEPTDHLPVVMTTYKHGELRGATIATIVARTYPSGCVFRRIADSSNPNAGRIINRYLSISGPPHVEDTVLDLVDTRPRSEAGVLLNSKGEEDVNLRE